MRGLLAALVGAAVTLGVLVAVSGTPLPAPGRPGAGDRGAPPNLGRWALDNGPRRGQPCVTEFASVELREAP